MSTARHRSASSKQSRTLPRSPSDPARVGAPAPAPPALSTVSTGPTSVSTTSPTSPTSPASASPPRQLTRLPSSTTTATTNTRQQLPPPPPIQPIYVLSADGSSLWLVDPSKPPGNEEPPPYAPFSATVHPPPSQDYDDEGIHLDAESVYLAHSRHRASTLSSLVATRSPPLTTNLLFDSTSTSAPSSSSSPTHPPRPRYHSSFSVSGVQGSGGTFQTPVVQRRRTLSRSSPAGGYVPSFADETTPLLSSPGSGPQPVFPASDENGLGSGGGLGTQESPQRGFWRSVFCGELDQGEDLRGGSWNAGWRRFWRPVARGEYWHAMAHLWFINFPFNLLVWPPLLAGTLAGTALLITLPIGAAVWWLTLILARSAARLETTMQLYYHAPLDPTTSVPAYHPIFYRIKEGTEPVSPRSGVTETPVEIVYEKKFLKNSWEMFCDHYSYSSLSYFLFLKPLIVLFSTIILLALFPPAVALVITLPVYLRAARRWGKWQASVAMDNL